MSGCSLWWLLVERCGYNSHCHYVPNATPLAPGPTPTPAVHIPRSQSYSHTPCASPHPPPSIRQVFDHQFYPAELKELLARERRYIIARYEKETGIKVHDRTDTLPGVPPTSRKRSRIFKTDITYKYITTLQNCPLHRYNYMLREGGRHFSTV
jgi:HAND domain-containing protein